MKTQLKRETEDGKREREKVFPTASDLVSPKIQIENVKSGAFSTCCVPFKPERLIK